MPVILDARDYEMWLDPGVDDPDRLSRLLAPYPAERMTAYPVSMVVNSARADSEKCIARTAPEKVQGSLFD
jgi:putative SOS response-associated peptidase YedK